MVSIAQDTEWNNARSKNIVSIQPGGPGYNFKIIGVQHGISSLSGGGRDVQHRWGAGPNGRDVLITKEFTGDPKPYTGTLMVSITRDTAEIMEDLENYLSDPCLPDVVGLLVRNGCEQLGDPTNYDNHAMALNVTVTSKDFSGALKKGAGTGESGEEKIHRSLSIDAGDVLDSYTLIHSDNKAQAEAEDLNVIIQYGHHLFAGKDIDSGPTNASVGYSSDRGKTWTWTANNVLTSAGENIDHMAWFQGVLLLACNTAGIVYATLDDAIAGTATAYTLATLGGSAWASTFPNTVLRVSDSLAICAGAGGFIAETSNGVAWTAPTASGVVTTNALTESAVATPQLAFLGGASGTLVRYQNGVYDLVSVASISDAITSLAVPPQRPNWLYVGTDAGTLYVCTDTTKATPTFTQVSIQSFTGGSIDALAFAGFRGAYMFLVHNKSGAGKVYRDLSGGACGPDLELIDSPTNAGINSIVALNHRNAVCVGQVTSTKGYIGRITQSV